MGLVLRPQLTFKLHSWDSFASRVRMVYASVKRRAAAMKALCALMMVAGAMLLASADDDVRQQDVSPAQRLAPGMSGAYFT